MCLWARGALCNTSDQVTSQVPGHEFLPGRVVVGGRASGLQTVYLQRKQVLSVVLVHLG